MAAAAVDVGYLAASYAVPETTLQSLLSAPTVELVQSLLVQIEAKAHEYDELKSQKLRADVELEAAVHDIDTRTRSLKASADKAVKEAETLREKLAQEENARQQIEAELQQLKATSADSSSTVQTLESRIRTLEAQNRDTVALHEAKSAAYDRLSEELAAQHQKFVNLRKQLSELEEKNQALENAATSVKFRESNFQQEIDLLRKNNEWFESELKARAADNTKFRKEKNAQLSQLQRENADAAQTIDSLRHTEATQAKRIEELEHKVEESLTRIQQLQEATTRDQQSSRAELDNARRLAALHQDSANTFKKRVQELQNQLAMTSDTAAEEVGHLQAEVESERNKAAHYEQRVTALELDLEQLQARRQDEPATPRRAINGSLDTPGRAGSPAVFSPGGSRLKGTMSTTQLYTENNKLKAELRALQEREEKRSLTLNEMLEELESRQPEIEELRQENERLTSETGEISALLEQALAEKEAARKETRKLQGDHNGFVRQKELDRQLIRDATFQTKLVLYQQKAQADGLDSLSQEEKQFLVDTAQNQIPDHLLDEDDTATGRLLSKHLVLFKNVDDLVEKNQELLRMIRQVADTYEGSEAQAKANQHEKDHLELTHLRDQLSQYEDEIKSLKLREQSFMKERDMYRRIATSRGQLPAGIDASMLAQSTGGRAPATPPPGSVAPSVEQTPHTKEVVGYERLVKELQGHLDMLKEQSATDHAALKQQADKLSKDNTQLQNENMRLNNSIQMIQERFEFQQHRINALQSEKGELQKRYDSLQDLFAKNDVRSQQASEELAEIKAQIDRLEREKAHLKGSESLWETIKARLTEDNKALVEERSRLNKMVADIQSLRNEQDLAEAENRRRLQSRVDSLEAELQNAKRKLEEEVEEHKKVTLRSEWEQTEKQRKIDDLLKATNEVRQELAAVKSSRDHLQARVDELQIELRNAQERATHLQARQTPRVNGVTEVDEDETSQDEELMQLAELQRKYERTQEDLESAKTQIETYKSIAQAAEEQLQSYIDAHEHAQQETNRILEEKDATIADLKQRMDEVSQELSTTNAALSELRGTYEQENLRLMQQKDALDAEIARLKEDANDYKAAIENQTQLVASQAEIATQAQQDYENELAKHGETMKSLRTIREEHNKLRTEVAEYKAQAEAASASLHQGEENWTSARERYESELATARTRYNDLSEHNKKLLQQFDGFQAQIASLKSSRLTVAAGQNDVVGTDADSSGLQDIITYLRQEKDILEVQFNMKDQEVKRLEQQLSHTQTQLDQTRDKLMTEQSRAQTQQGSTNLQALQQQIEQLNVYRESNSTLRDRVRRTEAQLAEKSKEVEQLNDQLQPLQARVQNLEGELEINGGYLKAMEADKNYWNKRYNDVLQTYERIDPKDLEALKQQIEDLRTERDQALEQVNSVEERIEAAREEERQIWNNKRTSLVNQSKAKHKELRDQRDELQKQVADLEEQLRIVQSELDSTRTARDEAVALANERADTSMAEEGQVNESIPGFSVEEKTALEARVAAAEHEAKSESNRAVGLQIQIQGLQDQVRKLEDQAGDLQQSIANKNAEISSALSQKAQAEARAQELQVKLSSGDITASVQSSGEVEKLREELAAARKEVEKLEEELAVARKEVEDLRTRADMADAVVGNSANDSTQSVADQVSAQVAAAKAGLEEREAQVAAAKADLAERETKIAERQAEIDQGVDAIAKRKLDGMKVKYNEHLNKKNDMIAELKAERDNLLLRAGDAPAKDPAAVVSAPSEQPTIKAELPSPEASEKAIKDFVYTNPVVIEIVKRNVQKKLAEQLAEQQGKKAANATAPASADNNAEQDKIIAEKVKEATDAVKAEQEKTLAQKVKEAKAAVKAEQEELMAQSVKNAEAKEKLMADKRAAIRESQLRNRAGKLQAQWDVVEKAATETPEKPVKEVYEVAKVAKPPPAPAKAPAAPAANSHPPPPSPALATNPQAPVQAPIPAPQPTQAPQAASPATTAPAPAPAPAVNNLPQANGARANPFNPTFAQPNFGQSGMGQAPGNPFAPARNASPNFPNAPMQNPMGQGGFGFAGGLPQPGFSSQIPPQQPFSQAHGRPNSPFGQQPPQQGNQPRPDAGTGPAALRGILGQQQGQSNIPRGGATGIPRAGGAGRGGGGRGRGQGQGPQDPSSPGGLNPGAAHFQPGGGRGQKRGPEDDGGGGRRGGKRARG